MKLKGKRALITGAAQGLGLAMAEAFIAEGAHVIGVDLKPFDHPTMETHALDVSNFKACETFFEMIKIEGPVDILVNNAGITKDAMTHKMTEQDWDLVIDVNLKGVFNLTRLIGPMMTENNFGSIINISSVVGEFGNIGQANYAATKAGVMGLTKTWAKEFARKGQNVRVNAIAPGYIMTDILKTVPQDLLDSFAQMTMLKRLGEPKEIASAAVFLASDDASYITGQILHVNGGMRL